MAIFDRFRRNRQQSVLPEEVTQYYQTEQRQRRGVAFLFALIALLLTVAIATALFFGGRWVYNQIWGDDDNQDTAQQEEHQDGDHEEGAKPEDNQNQGNTGNNPQKPAPAPAPAPQPAPAPATPNLGDTPAPAPGMPHTGDPGM